MRVPLVIYSEDGTRTVIGHAEVMDETAICEINDPEVAKQLFGNLTDGLSIGFDQSHKKE